MLKILFFISIVLTSLTSFSQEEQWIDGRFKAGFLLAHRSIMGHLANEHAFAGEISYMRKGGGEKAWHEGYKFPTYGLTGFFGSTGNRELMGHYFGLYTFMSFPFIKYKGYTFSGKMGAGLGGGTKVYDDSDSTLLLSMAVSTPLNALVCLGVESRYEFGNHALSLNLDMTHFSNGAFKVPNLGLNLPYVSIGYGYKFKESAYDTIPVHKPFQPYWEFGGVTFGSVKEVFPTGGKKYPVFGINAVARRYFKPSVLRGLHKCN